MYFSLNTLIFNTQRVTKVGISVVTLWLGTALRKELNFHSCVASNGRKRK